MSEPLISICLGDQKKVYRPGEELTCEIQIDALPAGEIVAVETSVLWHTEGKGEEDIGVHFFQRITPHDVENRDLRPLRRVSTMMPNSPLSYVGLLLTIRWLVRVRVFLKGSREFVSEHAFELSHEAST